jgi:hypothetical protein
VQGRCRGPRRASSPTDITDGSSWRTGLAASWPGDSSRLGSTRSMLKFVAMRWTQPDPAQPAAPKPGPGASTWQGARRPSWSVTSVVNSRAMRLQVFWLCFLIGATVMGVVCLVAGVSVGVWAAGLWLPALIAWPYSRKVTVQP